MELNRVGLKFVKDKVARKKRFAAAFDKLVKLGCLPETLAGTLYCFCKSYFVREPSPPPYGLGISFPPVEEIRRIRDSLQSAYEAYERIRCVDDYGIMEVLARHARCGDPPEGRKQVLAVLRWYVDSLSLWWVPRKDIVQSSAPIACCIYPKIATGEFRFPQVAELLACLGYRPDPKRQTKSMDPPDVSDLCDKSLERNFSNFRKAYPIFCDQLQNDLKSDHEKEENGPREGFDSWVVEKDLPLSVFDQLLPNRFDWKIVFSPPERKR